MAYYFSVFSLFFLTTALVSFIGAFIAWNRRKVKGATLITLLMFASGIGSFPIIFETAATTATVKIFWAKLEFLGGTATPLLYFLFAMYFTGIDKILAKKNILLFSLFPVISLVLIFTNEAHGLFWSGYSAISPSTNLMEYYHGPGFWIFYVAYSYILLAISSVRLLFFIIKNNQLFKSQGILILIGGLLPWSISIFYLADINITPGFDISPASIALSGLILFFAISRTKLLDLVPVAREILVETMPDGILAIDNQNRIQDFNKAARLYLGIPPKKRILGASLLMSGISSSPLLNAILNNKPSAQIEVDTEKGHSVFLIIIKPVSNQPGSRLVIIRDISDIIYLQKEKTEAQEKHKKLYNIFRLMSDNLPDMIWAKDLDKKFIFANRSICETILSAKDTEEPIGKTVSYYIDRRQKINENDSNWFTIGLSHETTDNKVIQSQKAEQFIEEGYLEGKYTYLDIRKAPIIDETGVMIGVVGSARDITTEKEAQSEIEKRDTLLAAMANATALLVESDDLDEVIPKVLEILGNATQTSRAYIFKNTADSRFPSPVTSQIFEWTDGITEAQIENPDMQNIPYSIVSQRVYDKLIKGESFSGLYKDLTEIEKNFLESQNIKSILILPIFVNTGFWGFLGFDDCYKEKKWLPVEEQILATTAKTIGSAYLRKQSRDELVRAKERAEESDRLKSAFLANMSHEIRTPMNGILGFTELLKEPKLNGEEQQEYIKIIEKSGNRMLNIINDIICTSTIETGVVKLCYSKVDICEQLDFIYKFFKPQADEKGIRLILDNKIPEEEKIIYSDKEKIYAILINLTRNAIKFTSSGFVEIGCNKNPDRINFYVKDSGIGIAQKDQSIIFERFRQVSESITRKYEGAGLGLSISKAYIEMLGGEISVQSESGKGSLFYVSIPLSDDFQEEFPC